MNGFRILSIGCLLPILAAGNGAMAQTESPPVLTIDDRDGHEGQSSRAIERA
jgi:hypothetical protein